MSVLFRDHKNRWGQFRFVAGAVLLLGLLLIGGCSSEDPPQKVDLSIRQKVALPSGDETTLTYAYLPQYSHSVSYQRHHLLVEYLKARTGLVIKQVFPDTFDEHMRMMGQGKIDISFSNPFIYIQLAERYCAQAFAKIVEVGGREKFRGEIICRTNNPDIKTLADCRGKKWIAVDPGSAGGYLYPLGHFVENGINREDFAEISFAPGPGGKQEKVILAVLAGKYDVGSIREGSLDVVANTVDISDIRVIARTRWYPGWVYAARRGLDPELVKRIGSALFDLDYARPEDRRILENARMKAVVSATDSDLDPIRQLWVKIGSDLGDCIREEK